MLKDGIFLRRRSHYGHAIDPPNWIGKPGALFRKILSLTGNYIRMAQLPEVAKEASVLGRKAVAGKALKAHSDVLLREQQTERLRVENEREKRTIQADVSRAKAKAVKEQCEAINSVIKLYNRLIDQNCIVYRVDGDIVIRKAPSDFDWERYSLYIERAAAVFDRLIPEADDRNDCQNLRASGD